VTSEEQWLDYCRQIFIFDSGARDVVLSEENIDGIGMEELPEKPKNFKY
jgi:hypothetical protein